MSSPAEPTELLRFDGSVECGRRAGVIAVQLRGAARGAAHETQPETQPEARGHAAVTGVTELLFAGVREPLPALPAQLHEARVLQMSPGARASFAAMADGRTTDAAYRIEAREGRFELRARSVQLHQEAAAAFFRTVPPVPVPRAVRLGWGILLGLLRLPGAARLLGR